MTRKSYNIDIKKPVFPFGQEFWPNKAEPVASRQGRGLTDNITVVDMKNALPTPFGYSSFFGTQALGGLKLPPITEKVFTYKDSLGNNTLVALGGYGAMFSNDGVTWNSTEVPTWVTQTANGSYEFQPDMGKNYTGFIKCIATFTKASVLAQASLVEVTPQTLGVTTQDVIALPVTATNTYHKAESITVNYDEAEVFNRLVDYIDPGLNSITVGSTYILTTAVVWSSYTAVVGDTVKSVLINLTSGVNTKATGVYASYESDSRVKIWATSAYSTTAMEYSTIFEVPLVLPNAGLLGTLANDQVPVSIPLASKGNLGYVVFRSAAPLTAGDFNIRRSGMYQVGGSIAPSGVTPTDDGSLYYTDINGLLDIPYAMPLTELEYALRQFNGVTQTGLTAEIYDTGIPLTTVHLGSRSAGTVQRINCNLVASDLVAGRVFILQSKGQLGSYTALAGDSIMQVVAGVVAAYNLAGAAIVTTHGGQIVSSTATDELFFQPASLVAMTASATNSEYLQIVDFKMVDNFVGSSELGKLYSLQFNTTTPSTNIIYSVYSDGSPVPVTTTTGAWSDANFEFTSAQIAAAAVAGTPLMVRLNGKHLVIKARSGGAGSVIGGYGFRFRAILTNGANMSLHVGPVAGLIKTTSSIVASNMRLYTKGGVLKALRSLGTVDASIGFVYLSPYQETSVPSTGISVAGLTPDTPTTDVFQFSAPADNQAIIMGNLVDLLDPYTPNTAVIQPTNPISGVLDTVTASMIMPVALTYNVSFTSAELITFSIFNPWTTAVIKNRLYCYRNGQGASTYILRLLQDGTGWEQLTPTFANMAQIEGITQARGRMVLWDTTGSVYTSSVTDPVDFTPSLKTRANVAKVDAVRGNIVLCLGYKDGYIIYSTASIILAKYVGGTTTFKYSTLSNEQGVLNTKAVTVVDDSMQFAYTQAGLFAVSEQGLQAVSPEASSYLKSSNLSPRLDFLENRYLSIAFAPTQPSWVVSKWEDFTGAVIKGVPEIPGGVIADSTGVPTDAGYYTVNVGIPAPLHIPAHTGTYVVDAGNGTPYEGATVHTFSEPAYDLVTLQDYIDWANRPSVIPESTYDGITFVIPAGADVEVWAIDGHLYFPDIASQIAGYGFFRYLVITDIYATDTGGFILPTTVPIQTITLQVNSSQFGALSSYLIETQIELARIQAFIDAKYNPISGLTSNNASSLTLMWHLGNLYAWGYVTLNDWQGRTIEDTVGNPMVLNVTLSEYPAIIGTNPVATLLGILTALGIGAPVPPLAVPTVSAVPDFVIPAGQFIATQGTAEPVDPIYTKALLLDTNIKNWGSCDLNFRNMIDFIPVNERSLNPILGAIATKYTYQNLAKAFAIMLQDGTLNLCTTNNPLSEITFGDIGFTNTGVTRFLDAMASFTQETGAVLTLEGSRDGERLSPLLVSNEVSQNGHIRLNKVLTGQWFRLKVSGRFDIKALKFSGELGGTR